MSNPCSVVCTECRLRGLAWRGKAQLDVQLTANLCPLLPPVIYATHTHSAGDRPWYPVSAKSTRRGWSTLDRVVSCACALAWCVASVRHMGGFRDRGVATPNLSSESVRNRVLFKRNDLGVGVKCGAGQDCGTGWISRNYWLTTTNPNLICKIYGPTTLRLTLIDPWANHKRNAIEVIVPQFHSAFPPPRFLEQIKGTRRTKSLPPFVFPGLQIC